MACTLSCAAGVVTDAGSTYDLHDGYKVPRIGFGVYRVSPGNDTYASVRAALRTGYRMIDTAEIYFNEADVGRAVRDSGIPRSQIFVTTKIWDSFHQYDQAINAGLASNLALGLGYIDLLLMHSPQKGKIVECYDAMLALRSMGVVRSVGVSNFGVKHLEVLRTYCRPDPVVNQFELHPLLIRERSDIVEYCRKANILVQPFGSMLSGRQDLLDLASRVAAAHNKTEAQVMLRWALDKQFQVIPKSTHVTWIAENFDVFDFTLTSKETSDLDGLPQQQIDSDYWNPVNSPVDVGDVSHGLGCAPWLRDVTLLM